MEGIEESAAFANFSLARVLGYLRAKKERPTLTRWNATRKRTGCDERKGLPRGYKVLPLRKVSVETVNFGSASRQDFYRTKQHREPSGTWALREDDEMRKRWHKLSETCRYGLHQMTPENTYSF